MRFKDMMVSSALIALLSACGGGGGTVASTPAPTPTPTNTTLTNLKYSQSFANDAAAMHVAWDTTTGTGINGSASNPTMAIAYDASTNGYTITTDATSQTFLPSDQTSQDDYDTIYRVDNTILTLVTKGYDNDIATQYVRMGLLQVNNTDGSTQNTDLTSFTYGLPTDAAATPRTGTASYNTQAFGSESAPGAEPKEFQGEGQLDIDFAQGTFSGHIYLTENGLVNNGSVSGGGVELTSVGQLSSTGSGLVGTAVYEGWDGTVTADLTGSLYGPSGEELGATFSGENDAGMTVTGSIVGQQDSSLTPANLSFEDMTQQQLFYTNGGGQLFWQNNATFTYSGYSSDESGGQFTIDDKISGAPNFTTYQKTFNNAYYGTQEVTLSLYTPGSANTELPLTYASFGHWQGSLPESYGGKTNNAWFTYGFQTATNALSNRTGTASYDGVAYATGTSTGGEQFDMNGTSSLQVDFGAETFTGAIALKGQLASGSTTDLGSTAFSGTLDNGNNGLTGNFAAGGDSNGHVSGLFYGPSGQEVAGTFNFTASQGTAAGTAVSGAFAAAQK